MIKLRHAIAALTGIFLCKPAFTQQDSIMKSKKDLNTVTVTGRKPLVTRKSDRFIVNVESSLLANGNSALEVLQQSPGIWIDPSGRISVRGRGVVVMINDVVQRMSADELAEYLKSLRSEDISRIEVITNPGAEYEAAGPGGIINIVLKRSRKDGFTGNGIVQYRRQGNQPHYNAGASINYKVNRWYLNGSYGIIREWLPMIDTADLLYPDNTRLLTYADRMDGWTRQLIRGGIGYELSKNQFIEIQQTVNPRSWTNDFDTRIQYHRFSEKYTGTSKAEKRRRFVTSSTNVNYQLKFDTLGSKITAIGEYTTNHKSESNHFKESYSGYFPDTMYSTSVPFLTTIYSAQTDYTKLFGNKLQWTSGVKYVDMKRDNELITPKEQTRFVYREQLYMGYTTAERTVKKMTYKAGMRVEHTRTSLNRRYTSFFPSVSLMRMLNRQKENSVYVSYVKRINRPGLNELNPARVLYSNYTATQGNPNLLPQYSHSVEAGVNFLHGFSVSVQGIFTKDIINLLVVQGTDNTIDYIFDNFGSSKQYGISMDAPTKFGKWYSMNNSINLSYLTYADVDAPDRTTFSAKSVHSLTPSWCDVEIIADYRSPVEYPAFRTPHLFCFDVGVSKKILKNKARLKFYVADVFNTVRELEIAERPSSKTIFYRKRPTRSLRLSLTYNFSGGIKFINRTIESGNATEKSRAGG